MIDVGKPRTIHMEQNDLFTLQVKNLLDGEAPSGLEAGGEFTFAFSSRHEMMDDERLELPMDPSHEFRLLKEAEVKEENIKKEEQRVRIYGTDPRIRGMICTETTTDLQNGLLRIKRGEELHEQIRLMNELRDNCRYHEAKTLGLWLLDQNKKFGVGYNKELLRILKQTVAALCDEVQLIDTGSLAGYNTTRLFHAGPNKFA